MILAEVDGKQRESSHLSGTSRDQVRRSDKQYFLKYFEIKRHCNEAWTNWTVDMIRVDFVWKQGDPRWNRLYPWADWSIAHKVFLTFLQCVRIKMLKMFMFLSMPQSKLSMTSIKSNLNWIWRVSDLFYWELSPFTVWRWHAQEIKCNSNWIWRVGILFC